MVGMGTARQSQGMDLFMSPLSSSFAVHVACLEGDVPFVLRRVERRTKRLDEGRDFREVAPQGIVPAITLPDGSTLTETAAILQYVADSRPSLSLAPCWGTPERYRLIEWLSFVATELHKKHLFVVFGSSAPEPVKAFARSTAASAKRPASM